MGNVTTNALIANLALEYVLHCLMFKGVLFQICVASCMNDLLLAFILINEKIKITLLAFPTVLIYFMSALMKKVLKI